MKSIILLMVALFALTACDALNNVASEPTVAPNDTEMTEDMAVESADTQVSDADMAVEPEAASSDEAAYNGPDWAQLELVNARTGETFTLADFAGKTVYVEPMATWCSNCRSQLRTVREAIPQLDSDQYVFIGLSVENGLADSTLADYTVTQGFDWPFAVASTELLQALVDEFGRSVTTPPSTPHFIIRPDGSYTELSTGFHSIDQIVAMAQAASSGS